jgi:hypothetical protein
MTLFLQCVLCALCGIVGYVAGFGVALRALDRRQP